MTSSDRAQRVADIVEAALEHDTSARPSFVDETCGDDTGLRTEVESLLSYNRKAIDFIETPAYATTGAAFLAEGGELTPGDLLGQYEIVSLLGQGGMGEVYLAEDRALSRRVAVKLVKGGFGRADLLRHFQREERILAGLTHPNIARLYGADVTEKGVPYFVMEYVEGERVDSYCERHHLTIAQRLELFRKICAAVTYAHQHLVIHRDLKPSNIRVTPEGEPKLLDFGVAKLLDDETSLPEQTITLAGVMTPDYASPEQVRGESMTTASDVYSLGVVLYELITGAKPYRTKSRRPDEISRAISEQEPTKPSVALGRGQKSDIRSAKLLRGDLDNIVLTAMRKEVSRRYSSAGQLSEDLRRHLEGLPVLARRDTFGYRASKFMARHRVAVAVAALVALAIIASLLVAVWQARLAGRQRDVAQKERRKVERINAFLQEMLGSAAPEAKGVDVKVADVLDEAVQKAQADLVNEPEVMAGVLLTLGKTYVSLAQYQRAETTLRSALEANARVNGELHPTAATAMGWLSMAEVYLNKPGEGEPLARKAIALQRALHPQGHEELGIALYALGLNLVTKGDSKGAIPVLEQASDMIKTHLGDAHGYYLTSVVMLARALELTGALDKAEPLYYRAIAIGERVEPRYRIFIAQAQSYLGDMLSNKGSYAEAEKLLRQAEITFRDVMGGETNSTAAVVKSMLALLYYRQNKYAEAEQEGRKSVELIRKYLGPEHPTAAGTIATLGLSLTRQAKAEEGETFLREALRLRQKTLAPDNFAIPATESALGENLAVQKRFAEAEPLLTSGYQGLKAKFGDADPRVAEARERLHALYVAWNKAEEARQYRQAP